MFNRPPSNPTTPTTPIRILLSVIFQLYRQLFRPLFAMTAVIAFVPAILSLLWQPGSDGAAFLWAVVLFAVEAAGYSAVMWRADALKRGGAQRVAGSTASGAISAVLVFGPRYFAGSFLLSIVVGLMVNYLRPLLLPLALFVVVRSSLYWPVVVLEKRSVLGAFTRSWQLTAGRWWRTLGLELVFMGPVFVGGLLILLLVVNAGLPLLPLLVVNILVSATVVPLLTLMTMALLEDYARASDGTPPAQLDDRPPTGDEPPR